MAHLTTAQLTSLKANIVANTATIPAGQPWTGAFAGVQVKDVPNNGDGNLAVAGWYNLAASPAFVLWRKFVSLGDVGKAFDGSEAAALTTANNSRLQVRAAFMAGGENPSVAGTRAFYADVFSVGGVTAAALLALWKRPATNVEKLFATGTGSDAAPAVSAFPESTALAGDDVNAALSLA
jgi:hypothetical protein